MLELHRTECLWILKWWSHKKLEIISFSTHSSQLGAEFCPSNCLNQSTKWIIRTCACRACFLLLISCCQPPAYYHQPRAHGVQGLTCPRSHSCSETGLGSMPGAPMIKQCFLSPRNLFWYTWTRDMNKHLELTCYLDETTAYATSLYPLMKMYTHIRTYTQTCMHLHTRTHKVILLDYRKGLGFIFFIILNST